MVQRGISAGNGRGSEEQASHAETEAEVEVAAVPGEQCDRGEDDGDLEKGFSEIVAGGLRLGVLDLVLELVGFGLIVDELGAPLGDLGAVVGDRLLGGGAIVDRLEA